MGTCPLSPSALPLSSYTATTLPSYALATQCPVLSYGVRCYTAKLNSRNRIPGTTCAEIAVSCIGFRGVPGARYGGRGRRFPTTCSRYRAPKSNAKRLLFSTLCTRNALDLAHAKSNAKSLPFQSLYQSLVWY
eukprot:3346199-Rhodomonas_salina.1